MKRIGRIFAVLSVVGLVTAAYPAFAQDDVISKRKKLMRSNNSAARALKKAVAAKDYGMVATKAKDVSRNAEQIPALFPKGSTAENSRAKPEIWTKWDGFAQRAATLKTAANALADAAEAKNAKEVEQRYEALGSACNSCHRSFRAPRKRR